MIGVFRRISLSQWIVLAMVAGILFGWLLPAAAMRTEVISTVFLHLIKCIIVPLIFAMLVVGIAGHNDNMKAVGRLAFKSLVYFELATSLALVIGMAAVNLVRPGVGVRLASSSEQGKRFAAADVSLNSVVEHLAPQSLFDAAARNDVLQVVVFAILFGVALARVEGKPKQTMLGFFEGLSEVMFKFTGLVMCFAPFL